MRYYITVQLKSDATFSRGEGVAGLVDVEIGHDKAGCPFIGGRVLKGLLVEEWVNLRFALGKAVSTWHPVAETLFGRIGATKRGTAKMHVGAATLPPSLLHSLHQQVEQNTLTATEILESLTIIRRQTSVDATTGAPEKGSLRAMRALIRQTPLIATVDFDEKPDEQALALLTACLLAVRRGGVARNRGRGRLSLLLHDRLPSNYQDKSFTQQYFASFAKEVLNS